MAATHPPLLRNYDHHHHNNHNQPHHSSSSRLILAMIAIAVSALLVAQFTLYKDDSSATISALLNATKQEFIRGPSLPDSEAVIDKIDRQTDSAATTTVTTATAPDYYMVFSTSCSLQQHWESLVLFYHAYKVRQPGNVTRIVSGCTDEEAADLMRFHDLYIKPMSDRFHLHLTPNYSTVQRAHGKEAYKYMNKPYGLRHWMEHALGLSPDFVSSNSAAFTDPASAVVSDDPRINDAIVMLLDPDMILLRPMLHDFTNENVLFLEDQPATKVVKHGYPISQQDGYLTSIWMKYNISFIVDKPPGEYVPPPHWNEGTKHWNSGPPYLATVQDMYHIAVKWTKYAPRVVEIEPGLFAEMFGFIFACLQLNLPFTFIKSLVVSTTGAHGREGWPYIDALPDDQICAPAPTAKLPIALHYCKRYLLGDRFFSKYRLKKNILDCDKPLLKPPDRNAPHLTYDYAIVPPTADTGPDELKNFTFERVEIKTPEQAKREAFMLCGLIDAVNEALRFHKRQKCGSDANLEESYSVHESPTNY